MKFVTAKTESKVGTGAEARFLEMYKEAFEGTPFEGCTVIEEPEPIMFRVGKLRYTPDFIGYTKDNEIVVFEIKSSKFQKGYYYSRARLLAASTVFRGFTYVIVRVHRHPKLWQFERILT